MPQFGGTSEKCTVCSKTVYLNEKIVVEDKEERKTFHKNCLRCSHCNCVLTLGNYASMQGIFYCKPHFKQLFATKGNYDEGFGKDKHSKNWTPQVAAAPSSFVPVDKDEAGGANSKKETPSSIASKFGRTTLNTEKCQACDKTVYATEKTVIEEKEGKKVFHKTCLKCSHCNVIVTLGNYASMQGVVYCKPHFKQLFAAKGNYDEGFGKEKATSKWEPQANAAPTTFVPVDKDEVAKEKRSAPEGVASRFKGTASNTEKCGACGKSVYATERIVVEDKEDRQTFHKTCLKCSHCQVVLTLGNYASMNGVYYCKPHFKQLFAAKGNYDEGFGKEKHTKKWSENAGESAPSTSSAHEDKEERKEREQKEEKEEDPQELEREIENERLSQESEKSRAEEERKQQEEREEQEREEEERQRREEREREEQEEREKEEREERERDAQEVEERKRLEDELDQKEAEPEREAEAEPEREAEAEQQDE